jgi:hypothetical protein
MFYQEKKSGCLDHMTFSQCFKTFKIWMSSRSLENKSLLTVIFKACLRIQGLWLHLRPLSGLFFDRKESDKFSTFYFSTIFRWISMIFSCPGKFYIRFFSSFLFNYTYFIYSRYRFITLFPLQFSFSFILPNSRFKFNQ